MRLVTDSVAQPKHGRNALAALRSGSDVVWLRNSVSGADGVSSVILPTEVRAAADRFERFVPVFARLFDGRDWDGHIRSALLDGPAGTAWLVKGDHDLPVTGSIKARGGIHALLSIVEQIAAQNSLSPNDLLTADGKTALSRHSVVVASTGNLGYSIGVFARAFGLGAEIHMSADAKSWKKDRLRMVGAQVVEHDCDYSQTLHRARARAGLGGDRTWLIDDECSRDLLTGYAVAADELDMQLAERGVVVDAAHPLVVYVPCGVGGAPGGIAHGLKRRFGADVVTVFVEPLASPCILVALASGNGACASVYDYGCDNVTIADGLAAPRASELVLNAVGGAIDAVVAVSDTAMIQWVGEAWRSAGLKLEPSAAAAFAAFGPLQQAITEASGWPVLDQATHLFWATGGSLLPADEFAALLEMGR